MKKVNLGHIKGESFNLISVVEDCIEIDTADIKNTLKGLENTLTELEILHEALYLKKEKLNKKTTCSTPEAYNEKLKEIRKNLKEIKLEPLSDSKKILEKNKEILELKVIQKILRYSIELKVERENVLETLFKSDIQEDWEFLCTLLYFYLKFSNIKDKDIFSLYSKKIEDKMVDLFNKSLKASNISTCKACYLSIEQLGKGKLLYEQYLYSFKLMNKPIEIKAPTNIKIDLNNYKPNENSFNQYFKDLTETVVNLSENSFLIFGNDFKFHDFALKKIFRISIYRSLDLFLNIKSPGLFLLSLIYGYNKVKFFCDQIISIDPNFEAYFYLNDTFNQYLSISIQKEKEFFDEIFDILIFDYKTEHQYYLFDELIVFTEDYEKAFLKILYLVDFMRKRCKILYSKEDEVELIKYFFRRLNLLIDKIVINTQNKIEIIEKVSKIYLITKKYLCNKFYLIDDFYDKINEVVQEAFESKVNYINLILKSKISDLFFTEKSDFKKILNFIKTSIKEAEVFNGRNFNIFADRILSFTYKKLYKQILSIVFKKEQGENLLLIIDEFYGYSVFINRINMSQKILHLKNICLLITVELNQFKDLLSDLEGALSEKELGKLIKCRKDAVEVEKLI